VTTVHAVVSRPGPVESAILAELAASAPGFTVERRAAGGVTLRCLESESESASASASASACQGGSGPPLVLLHGRGQAATSWFPLLPELGRSFRVIAVDLPGFGHSAWPPFARGGGFEAGLRFFTDPVEALLLDMGLAEAAIVGHSLGGLVGVELALRRRVRPPRLALIGAMGLGPEMTHVSRAYFHLGPERLARHLGEALFTRLHPAQPEREAPHAARAAALYDELCAVRGGRPEAAAAFRAMAPLAGPVPHRRDRLGEIEAEALVLWGERDEVFPAPVAIAAAAALPRAELCILPGGHSPHLEAPEKVLPILGRFLAGQPRQPRPPGQPG